MALTKVSRGLLSTSIVDNGNATAITIDSSENVGIGTSTTVRKLTVNETGTSAIAHFESDQSASKVYFHDADTSQTYSVALGSVGDDMAFYASSGGSERMRIDASGNVGIDTTSPNSKLDTGSDYYSGTATTVAQLTNKISTYSTLAQGSLYGFGQDSYGLHMTAGQAGQSLMFHTGGSAERVRIDGSGNLLVGKTAADGGVNGGEIRSNGETYLTATSARPLALNRKSTDGAIATFAKDGSTVGSIGSKSAGTLFIAGSSSQNTGVRFFNTGVAPCNSSGDYVDNSRDLGSSSVRWDDVYATNGTIQTSDRNEKQDIAELSEAEQRVAVACKGLMRKFRWKDAVSKKGDDARIHFGIIAQDLQAAFETEGLDAGDYAMFMSDTWWEQDVEVPAVEAVDAVYETQTDEEGNETQVLVQEAVEAVDAYTRTDTFETAEEAPEGATEKTRLGVRYSELLAFIISAL